MTSRWTRWRLKSSASRLFTQPFIQAQIEENIKAPRHWPLWGEFTDKRWIPRTNGHERGKCLHLMTSSCEFSSSKNPSEIITMTSWWAGWRLKSPASRLFAQPFVGEQTKENIKAPNHWPYWGETSGDRGIPFKRPVTRKMFPFDDAIMFSAKNDSVTVVPCANFQTYSSDFGWIDYTLAPSQWDTSLQSNTVSHLLGTNLESALILSHNYDTESIAYM